MTTIETSATDATIDALLPPDLLARMDERAPRYDRDNTFLAHELIGKLCLGVDPDDAQRWG